MNCNVFGERTCLNHSILLFSCINASASAWQPSSTIQLLSSLLIIKISFKLTNCAIGLLQILNLVILVHQCLGQQTSSSVNNIATVHSMPVSSWKHIVFIHNLLQMLDLVILVHQCLGNGVDAFIWNGADRQTVKKTS